MSSFPLFQALPERIRLKIWSLILAEAGPRVHTLGVAMNYDKSEGELEPGHPILAFSIQPSSPLWESTVTPRQIASVCTESRRVALNFFPHSIEFTHPFSDEPGILRFNGAKDIISLEFQGHLLSISKKRVRRRFVPIRHLALNIHEMQSRDLAIMECFPVLETISLIGPRQPGPPFTLNSSENQLAGAKKIKFLVSELMPETYLRLAQDNERHGSCWSESHRRISEAEIYLEREANEILRRANVRSLIPELG